MNSRKTFTLRIEEDTLNRLHYIAKLNKRSANNQIEILIETFISILRKPTAKFLYLMTGNLCKTLHPTVYE